MKAKKLFFGLFCLGALVLGACSGNKSSSSAPASSSSGSQPAPSSSEPAHVHQWDEHGVCSCGEYRGDTKAASSSDPYTKSLVAGEENYFRLQVEKDQYHAFFSSLEEEQIDLTKTKLWRKTNVWEELDIAYGIWYFGNNSDGYIYVKIVTLVNVASATAYTDVHHHYNWTDFGVCPYCGAYGGHEDWELNQGQFVHVNSGEKIWQRLPVQNNTDYGFFFDNTWPYAGVTEATIEIWYITNFSGF